MIALLALTFTIVMGAAAITVDLGRAWVQDVRLQVVVDAAALAGVRELPSGTAQAISRPMASIPRSPQSVSTPRSCLATPCGSS
jgi:Flp pilus assembly protein TadG